jgi:nicotinate-nucleotide adenylyltransferase
MYGGSLNPPGHHVIVVERLINQFPRVDVIPCGARRDKASVNETSLVDRRAMAQLAFGHFGEKVRLDFSDLDDGVFTPSYLLLERAGAEGDEPWLVVGSDLIQNGGLSESPIQREWRHGQLLWETARFVITEREGFPVREEDLPPQRMVIGPPLAGASSDIRERVRAGLPITGLVPPAVEAYIHQRGLYLA